MKSVESFPHLKLFPVSVGLNELVVLAINIVKARDYLKTKISLIVEG